MTSPMSAATPAPVVTVSFEGPGRQRRLTVAFRVILAIPHFLYAVVLVLVAFFAVIAAWFAALVLGRLPRGLAEFLARVVQYIARINAYGGYLLTDRYPPFDLGRAEYAVSVEAPSGVRLNRAAVFFRALLMIPAGIVAQLLGSGFIVVAFVAWLLTLMLGRLPIPLFEAFAAILRYQTRFYAYGVMLTSEYPRGLFGDRVAEPEVPAQPLDTTSALPATPRITSLTLSRGAKWIIGLVLLLGVATEVGNTAVSIASLDTETADELEETFLLVDQGVQRYGRETQRCAATGAGLECLREPNAEFANAFRAFRAELRSFDFSEAAIDEAEQLDRDAAALIDTLERMASATDPAAYTTLVEQFSSQANAFDASFNALLDAVRFS